MNNEQEPNAERDRFMRFVHRSTQVATAQIAAEDPYTKLEEASRLRALNTLNYAKKVPEAWPQMYELLMTLAPKMEMAGHRNRWIEYLESGVACSQQQHDQRGKGELCLHIGYLCLLMGRYEEAKTWLNKSQICFCHIADTSGKGRALNRLAMVAQREGKLSLALALVTKARNMLDPKHPDIANSYYVLGVVSRQQKQWQDAEQYFRTSLGLWKHQGDERRIAWGYNNLGSVLGRQKKYNTAIECYKNALKIFREIHDPVNRAATLVNLGNAYQELQEFEKSEKLYLEAQQIFLSYNDNFNLAKALLNNGLAYMKLHKFQAAESSLLRSIEIWNELEVLPSLCNAMDSLGETYRKQRKFEEASKVFIDAINRLQMIQERDVLERYQTMIQEHYQKAQMKIET